MLQALHSLARKSTRGPSPVIPTRAPHGRAPRPLRSILRVRKRGVGCEAFNRDALCASARWRCRVPMRGSGSAQPDDPCHVDRHGDRSQRRDRARRDRDRHQRRDEHHRVPRRRTRKAPTRSLRYRPAIHRRSGGHRLQAQRPDRHHPADCGDLAAGHPARSRRGDRRGPRGQRGAAGPEHVERAGAGHRLQADSVASAQRATLSAAHHADPGRDPGGVCRLRRESRRVPARAAPSTTA